jgi:hypothetical protein
MVSASYKVFVAPHETSVLTCVFNASLMVSAKDLQIRDLVVQE